MDALQTVTLHFTKPLVTAAVNRFWLRTVGVPFIVAYTLMVLFFGYLVAAGDRSWLVGALGTVLIVAFALLAAIYIRHYRESIQRFRNLGSDEAVLEFDETMFRLSSEIGKSEMKWNLITEVWVFPEFWLVLITRAQFFTLPTADMNERVQSFLRSRFETVGAKVA